MVVSFDFSYFPCYTKINYKELYEKSKGGDAMDFSIGINTFYPVYNQNPINPVTPSPIVKRGSEGTANSGRVKPTECQTCKNRKYVDGSNEGNVSFKAPGHISPEASAGVVMSHELEHVANAKAEGNEPGKELVSSTVSLKMSICPECGRAYVSGGVTQTTMKSSTNPFDNAMSKAQELLLAGMNFDQIA